MIERRNKVYNFKFDLDLRLCIFGLPFLLQLMYIKYKKNSIIIPESSLIKNMNNEIKKANERTVGWIDG